jgi:hypothetical protein
VASPDSGGGPPTLGVTPPPANKPAAPEQGLQNALQGGGPGWQQTQISAGQGDLGTRTPSMMVDALQQVVARRGRAY